MKPVTAIVALLGDSVLFHLRTWALSFPLNVKRRLANNRRNGISLVNDSFDVCSKSHAPTPPPTRLTIVIGMSSFFDAVMSWRYATALAAAPGVNANVAVAFAGTGRTPVSNRAGNAIKVPPPATEFMAPAVAAAPVNRSPWEMVILSTVAGFSTAPCRARSCATNRKQRLLPTSNTGRRKRLFPVDQRCCAPQGTAVEKRVS